MLENRYVYLEADQLVGPVVALVEQNAIELDLRNVGTILFVE